MLVRCCASGVLKTSARGAAALGRAVGLGLLGEATTVLPDWAAFAAALPACLGCTAGAAALRARVRGASAAGLAVALGCLLLCCDPGTLPTVCLLQADGPLIKKTRSSACPDLDLLADNFWPHYALGAYRQRLTP